MGKRTKESLLWILLAASAAEVAGAGAPPVRTSQIDNAITLENGKVKGVFRVAEGRVEQTFYASRGEDWVPVANSLRAASGEKGGTGVTSRLLPSALYDSSIDRTNRLLVSEALREMRVLHRSAGEARVLLRGDQNGAIIEETVELRRGDSFLHIEARARLAGQKPCLEYLLLPFEFRAEGKPDVTRAPTLKPAEDSVIGDRVFVAPVVYAQKDGLFAALMPDVEVINRSVVYARGARQHPDSDSFRVPIPPESVSMPTVLDVVLPRGPSSRTVFAYGLMDEVVHQHVWFEHRNAPGAMVRELSTNVVRIAMDLLLRADAPRYRGYQSVVAHQWQRFGSNWFASPRPQAMPYTDYALAFYPPNFTYQGYEVAGAKGLRHREVAGHDMDAWQEWQEMGEPVGGLRMYAPQWYHLIANLAWFNNVCDATGLYYWGNKLGKENWVERARRMVNLALSAPQNQGLFPGVYDLQQRCWKGSLWRPPLEGYDPDRKDGYWNWKDGAYQTASASVTAGYLMQYRRTCEANERILPYVRRYGDFLLAHIQTNGCVPAWFDPELRPLPSMKWNPDGGAHAWVLGELFLATGEAKYLEGAKRLAKVIQDEVLPQQRWGDFEAFYSCATRPETSFDERTGQWPCNTMSMSWALQGFLALHEATGAANYLDAAVAIADYASLFQAVWAPHYVVTAFPFGGFTSQLGDAEWLDQRAHRFADPFVRIGLLAGRQDLIERGIAAARSCLTLGNHPRHLANGIYSYPDFPIGVGPENVDHEGFPQRPMASAPSWNTVGGLAGVAHVCSRLGGVYVDCTSGIAVGVDGLRVVACKKAGRTLRLEVEDQLAELPSPFEQPFTITLRVTGLSKTAALDRLHVSWISSKRGTARAATPKGGVSLGGGRQEQQLKLAVRPDGGITVVE